MNLLCLDNGLLEVLIPSHYFQKYRFLCIKNVLSYFTIICLLCFRFSIKKIFFKVRSYEVIDNYLQNIANNAYDLFICKRKCDC